MDDHAAISRDDPARLNGCQTALGMEEFMAPQQNLWVAEVGLRQMIRSVLSG